MKLKISKKIDKNAVEVQLATSSSNFLTKVWDLLLFIIIKIFSNDKHKNCHKRFENNFEKTDGRIKKSILVDKHVKQKQQNLPSVKITFRFRDIRWKWEIR